jgi:quercetin dioxygenase-like cupin family protein
MTNGKDAGPALTTPARFLGLLDYQEGAVVSRTLIKKGAGTLTLFAFDAGEGLSEHTTPHDAVVQVLEGTVEITVGGTAHRVTAGEGLLLPAEIPHALSALTPFKMLLVMIREPGSRETQVRSGTETG